MICDLKHNKLIFGCIVWLLCAAFLLSATQNVCFADEYEDKIADMQKEEQQTQDMITNLEKQTKATKDSIQMLQEQKKATESNVSNLKEQSDALKNEIEGYSGKLNVLDGQIEEAENEMSKVSAEIVSLNNELAELRSQLDEKQTLLRKRMKNVYEKGGSKGMIVSILEAKSFTDILTRYEYANAMIRYDRQKIAECKELEAQLEEKVAEVEAKEE